MTKLKVAFLIFIGGLVHFLLMMKVVVDRLSCGVQPHCVGLLNRAAGYILEAPLGSAFSILHGSKNDVDLIGVFGNAIFIFYFANSVLTVGLLWLLINQITKPRRGIGS